MLEQLAVQQSQQEALQQLPPAAAGRGVAAACSVVDNALRGIEAEVNELAVPTWHGAVWSVV